MFEVHRFSLRTYFGMTVLTFGFGEDSNFGTEEGRAFFILNYFSITGSIICGGEPIPQIKAKKSIYRINTMLTTDGRPAKNGPCV